MKSTEGKSSQEKKKIDFDKTLVKFILAWHNLIYSEKVSLTTEKRSSAYQKRIKRQVQKDLGTEWKKYWRNIIRRGWKEQDAMKQTKNLFWLESSPMNPAYRPRKDEKYLATYHLRNYFIKLTGKPQMALIATEIFNEDYATFKVEYYRRKKYIEQLVEGQLHIQKYKDKVKTAQMIIAKPAMIKTTDELIQICEDYKERIEKALSDKIPIYKKF